MGSEKLLLGEVVVQTNFEDLKLVARGKVRDIYEIGENLLIVTTDRVSAFDVVLPNGIPGKGKVLTAISEFWFNYTKDIIPNHLITTDVSRMPAQCQKYKDQLEGRSMLVRRAEALPVECVVRGYLSGSGWKEYKASGVICGIEIAKGLRESDKLPAPIFTPSTKAEVGIHDENITFQQMVEVVGKANADKLKKYTLDIYNKAYQHALGLGVIIADTKLEFGIIDGEIAVIDEMLTPDSSRFWYADKYEAGRAQDSIDKQLIRDYLLTLGWDQTPPAPTLPKEIVDKAARKYLEVLNLIVK